MPKPTVSPRPRSFLLRCWRERSDDDTDDTEDAANVNAGDSADESLLWRFSLREVAETPQEHSFSSPELLITFLLANLREETITKQS